MGRELPVEQCKSDLELHGLTQCAHCGDLMHQEEAVVVVYYKDHQQEQEHVCSQNCKQEWRLAHIRMLGL